MARNLWKIVNILVDRPHAQLQKLTKVREVILEDRLSTMFVIALDCHTGHVNAFLQMN